MSVVADNLDEFANDPEMVAMFVNNATELADQIETDLVAIEKTPAESRFDVVNRIFRAAHTIKGESGFVGLGNIGRLAHSMENILDRVRDSKIEPTHLVVSTLLNSLDTLRTMIERVDESESVDLSHDISSLTRLDEGSVAHAEPVAAPAPAPVPVSAPAPAPAPVVVATPVAAAKPAPVVVASPVEQAPTATATTTPTPSTTPPARVRVLIIDDEPMVVKIASRALTKAGIASDNAGSAEDAIKMMRRNLYNVVICDLQLPGMSGVELLPKLKSVSPMVQVVMLTGNSNLVSVLESLEGGAADFLPKTQDYAQLVKITQDALERIDRWIPLMKSRK